MDITQLLHSLLISILLLPCFSILVVAMRIILQLAVSIFPVARAHFTWRWDSLYFGYHRSPFDHKRCPDLDVRPSIAVYEHASKESEEQVECVVCLCNIEVGEEIRELRCQHLFHRACLDRWFECLGSTCPLCRDPLVSCKAKKVLEDMDDEELEDMVVPLTAYILGAWGL